MGGTSRTLAYQYDLAGNRTRITHPDGHYFATDYDQLNRPTMLREGQYNAMAGMAYYGHGGPAGRSLANGATSEWGYDAVQRLTAVVHGAAGSAGDVFQSLTYNPASQIATRAIDNDAYAWTGHYGVARAYTTNGRNQYTQVASTTAAGSSSETFGYDGNGNLNSDATSLGTTTYDYDAENRLVSTSSGATLSYDPLGRLWQISLGSSTTRFLYDGDALVEEYDGANVLRRRYAHWVGSDVPLLWFTNSDLNSPDYLHADQQGSIVLVTDAAGNPTINRYDEYGIPAASNVGRFQYTGQAYLPEIGMYYYRARMYSPTLGRFLQTDPIGHGGGMNLYAYVLNDPVNFTDPSGLDPPQIVTGSRLPARQDVGPGLCGGCSGFTGQAAGAFLGLSSGGSGGFIYVPGIPGSATGTGGTGPDQTVTVTAGTAGYFYFAGGFGAGNVYNASYATGGRRTSRPSVCTSSFGGSALSAEGVDYDLRNIEFREGLDDEASELTRAAFALPNVGAVTQWNVIYVKHWAQVTDPHSPVFWEEIRHSVQYQNTWFFHAQYGASSLMAGTRGGDMYFDNGFEREAQQWSQTMAARYRRERPCGD